MKTLNATHLFEKSDAAGSWPASSESFWSALFGLFILYLGTGATPRGQLRIWRCTDGSNAKWYEPRPQRPSLRLENLTFDSIALEPRTLSKTWPGTELQLTIKEGGFSPDVMIRSPVTKAPEHFFVIENKVTDTAYLADNQMENYERLAVWLNKHHVSFDILFLQSVGCSDTLYKQAKYFQNEPWGSHFGILLWEDVFREMLRTDFAFIGLPIASWQRYTAALESDCIQR